MRILLLLLALGTLGANDITLTIEHAQTPEELSWGLMGREELSENHGMLFHYPQCTRHKLWMFGCLIPLSAAFLDEEGKIVEIHQLEAYPDKVKNTVPIESYEDLENLDLKDPVIRFFIKKSVISSKPVKYALEMPYGWFHENGVAEGDTLIWESPVEKIGNIGYIKIYE